MESRSARPTPKTYSKRKRLDSNKDALKRRRIASPALLTASLRNDETSTIAQGTTLTLTSTPISELNLSDAAIFSDDNAPNATPPSSPPGFPWDREPPAMEGPATEKPAAYPIFTRQPLTPVDSGATNRGRQPAAEPSKAKKQLVQMQINLGQSFQKQCKTCGMEYIPSNIEDAALHRKFHAQNVGGVELDRTFVKKMDASSFVRWRGNAGDFIISLERGNTTTSAMRRTRIILDVVQKELGAVDISDDMLYSACDAELPSYEHQNSGGIGGQCDDGAQHNRYKIYLYIRGTKCIGVCLAERIDKAYKVMETNQPATDMEQDDTTGGEPHSSEHSPSCSLDGPICITDIAEPALLGISRIWTSSSARRGGIATALLETTRKTFRRGSHVPRDLIAFSQPTDSGARLARRWFEKQYGWHVYTD
ncbi:hypothetical protein MBLNU459_g7833t2 [Dothideomycetes sp. NU459]